jgi:hypothetical protein
MARLRRVLDGLIALGVMLAGDHDEPSPLAVETLFAIATTRGVEALARYTMPLARSRAGEFHAALRVLSVKLEAEGYRREADQVLRLWAWGSL